MKKKHESLRDVKMFKRLTSVFQLLVGRKELIIDKFLAVGAQGLVVELHQDRSRGRLANEPGCEEEKQSLEHHLDRTRDRQRVTKLS